jgi:hypothetical protein
VRTQLLLRPNCRVHLSNGLLEELDKAAKKGKARAKS